MIYQDIFSIRRYVCVNRSHHPVIYVNLITGETLVDEAGYGTRIIPWHQQEPASLPFFRFAIRFLIRVR